MSFSGALLLVFLSLFCSVALIFKIFHKIWWTPNRTQKLMASQGIRGPSYRLIHGNKKEISNMCKEAMSRPLSLSHDVFAYVQPHIHSWSNIYGIQSSLETMVYEPHQLQDKILSSLSTGKNYLQWLGSRAQLVIREPELCKQILNNKDGGYPKRQPDNFVKKLLGNGLVTIVEAEKWSKLRKISNHTFHGESLKTMIPDMIASAEIMLKRWESHEGKEIEVVEEFRLFTSEVISRTAFGSSYLEGQHIFEMLMKLALLIFRNAHRTKVPGVSNLFKTSAEIESEKLEKGIRDSIIELVKKREQKASSGEEESFGSDFLGSLLRAHHDANQNLRISVDDLVDDCKTFYFAGQDTTNSFLVWTVFLLAHHTNWQEEARKEVLQLFGKQNPNPDGLSKLKTMSMILNESLRLYPPIAATQRETVREVRLGNLIVPANVELLVSVLALHHEPQFWGPDVHLFKPERFSGGIAKATNNNAGAFMPFGLGPRSCVGLNFATTEAKIALTMILQRYSFTLSPAYIHSPYQVVTIRPQHGLPVLLQRL